MADPRQPQSVFMPVNAQDFEGPFSAFLQPAPAAQPPQGGGGPTTAVGGVAHIASQFLQGATEGRIKAFQQQENDKLQRLSTLNSYVQNLYANPDVTTEGKNLAQQTLYQALGGAVQNAGPIPGAPAGGSGQPGAAGQPTPHHKVADVLKQIAIGMTGGKAPKGAPDVGAAMADIHSKIFSPDGTINPAYNKKAIIATNEAAIRDTLSKMPPEQYTREQAATAIAPQRSAIYDQDPQRGAVLDEIHLGNYRPLSPLGATMQDVDRMSGAPPARPPGPAAQPSLGAAPGTGPAPASGASEQGSGPIAATSSSPPASPGPPPAPAGPPPGVAGTAQAVPVSNAPGAINMLRARAFVAGKIGVVDTPKNVEYNNADGVKVRTTGMFMSTPDFTGWVDPQTHVPLSSQGTIKISTTSDDRGYSSDNGSLPVRKASWVDATTGKPKSGEVYLDPSTNTYHNFRNNDAVVAKDNTLSLGEDARWVRFNVTTDTTSGKILGVAGPAVARPTAPRDRAASAASIAAQRRVDVLNAASKIVTDYTTQSDTKATGPALMKEIEGALPSYFRKKEYAPYSADIYSYVRNELRQGTFKDPGELLKYLGTAKADAKQDASTQQMNDKIDQMSGDVIDHLNDIWGQIGNQSQPAAQPRQSDPAGVLGTQPPSPVQQ